VVPLDVTLSGTEAGLEGVSREPSVASGQGSAPRSLHVGAVHKLGVTIATRSSVARWTDVANPAPPPRTGGIVNVLGRLNDLQNTTALLVGRVAVVEVATQRHTDTAASIDGRFDQLMGVVQGLHGSRGVVFGPLPMGPMGISPPMGMPPSGPGVPDPHAWPMFPYPYTLPQDPEMIPGHPVSPINRFESSLS
jgi:hypothetical protein